jgi:predicted nucleic acid-binding protein
MRAIVLDSFALVAYFRGEAGGAPVKELLQRAERTEKPLQMTEVNYAEAKYTIIRKDGIEAWREAANTLDALPIEFHPVDRDLADRAANLKSSFRLSLADAFAAALASLLNAELVTGDPEFESLATQIKIRWLKG